MHSVGNRLSKSGKISEVPAPLAVEIMEQDGAYYLLSLDENGVCVADTWHPTIENAKRQAKFEFEIEEADWVEVVK